MIIFDLEWNRGYDKTPLEEILQIGAVRIDRMGGPIRDTFCVFIRPCVHKKLNRTAKYLPELNAAMESTITFPEALRAFVEWCGDDTVFADWGGDDFSVLCQNCNFWNLPCPQPQQLLDLQAAFSLQVETNQGVALYRAVEYCGIPDPFTYHNALNDAVYTAMVTGWVGQEAMDLLALPKEIRRLKNVPPFPPQEDRVAGGFVSLQKALNSRAFRRQLCPLCGEASWVRRWYTADLGHYYADFRCRTHGKFVCRLQVHNLAGTQWQGVLSVPPVTPELLQEFTAAIQTASVPCKSGTAAPKKHRHPHHRRPAAKRA